MKAERVYLLSQSSSQPVGLESGLKPYAGISFLLQDIRLTAQSIEATVRRIEKKTNHYDVIVVGAGPAGSTAAFFLASAGLRVVIFERGPYPGSKNVGGGALYAQMVEPLFPNFLREAPIEGLIVDQQFWILTDDAAVILGIKDQAFSREPYNRVSILKAKFDSWLAGKAVQTGARLLLNAKVEEIIFEQGQAIGVNVLSHTSEKFYAPVIILAEGANAMLATKAGLIPPVKAQDMSLYVKEILLLPPELIQERFHLAPGQAAVIGLYGYSTNYLHGTASLYTGQDFVGINAGVLVEELVASGYNPNQFLDNIKRHPFVKRLIHGGRPAEYVAHLIPEGGYASIPRLVHNGVLIVGDTAGFVNGVQGVNLAMYSGKYAADAVIQAFKKQDFSAKGLKLYQDLLNSSFIMKDFKANARVPRFYEEHEDFMDVYPKIIRGMAYRMAMVYPMAKREKRKLIVGELTKRKPVWTFLKDVVDTLRVSY